MKNLKFTVGILIASVTTIAFAGKGTGISTTTKYSVVASLSRTPNVDGSLAVYQNVTGADGKATPTKLFNCTAIGNPANQFSGNDKAARTPRGGTAWATAKYVIFNGEYEPAMPYATFFAYTHGQPVAIHAGPLNSNSHACIRTTPDCALRIQKLAEENSVQGSSALPESTVAKLTGRVVAGVPRTVSGNQLSVQVNWFN